MRKHDIVIGETVAPLEEEEEVLSQVEARTGYQTVTSINEAGEVITLGRVRKRAYEGSRHINAFALETADGKEHRLGTGGPTFKVFSHSDILVPFLDKGFKPAKIMHARGGASCLAFLRHPERVFEDPITWDAFADESGNRRPPLELSVRIRSDLRRGHGLHLSLGYFRLICTNGLIAKVLGLGEYRVNHANYSIADLLDWVNNHTLPLPDMLPKADTKLLTDLRRYVGMTDPEEIARLPRLLRQPVSKLAGELNKSTRAALLDNLERLEQGSPTMTVLDLANAYTTVAHASRSHWSIYDEADPMVKALRDLVELVGLQQGVQTFESA